jgi:hypothetical protein
MHKRASKSKQKNVAYKDRGARQSGDTHWKGIVPHLRLGDNEG